MANLFLMMGIPGAGKSTFIKNRLEKLGDNVEYISRDEIRFSMLRPYENYFAHENEVRKTVFSRANRALEEGKNVIIDQTSLTPKSRKWVLENVPKYDAAYLIWIDNDIETCIKNNENRKGTQAYVPPEQIRRMGFQLVRPSRREGFNVIYRYNAKNQTLDKLEEI